MKENCSDNNIAPSSIYYQTIDISINYADKCTIYEKKNLAQFLSIF